MSVRLISKYLSSLAALITAGSVCLFVFIVFCFFSFFLNHIAYKRDTNIRDMLLRSKLQPTITHQEPRRAIMISVKRALSSVPKERDVASWYERSLMVRWVVGSILHGVDPLSYFSFQPVLHDWYNKGRGMCYPVCGMMHIKEPLLLIDKSSLCGGSGFPLSLSEWSFTICMTPYNRK